MKNWKIPTWIKRIFFKIEFAITRKIVVSKPSLVSYPILSFMVLNEKLLWERYKKGHPVHSRIRTELFAMKRRLSRNPSLAVKQRHREWIERVRKEQETEELLTEMEQFIKKNNIKLKNEN